MLWHHNARVNSHQRWKQTRFRVCFHLWCELTSTVNVTEWQLSWNSCNWFCKLTNIDKHLSQGCRTNQLLSVIGSVGVDKPLTLPPPTLFNGASLTSGFPQLPGWHSFTGVQGSCSVRLVQEMVFTVSAVGFRGFWLKWRFQRWWALNMQQCSSSQNLGLQLENVSANHVCTRLYN